MARSMATSGVGWEWVLLLQEISSKEAQMMLMEMIKNFDMARTLQQGPGKNQGVIYPLMKCSHLVRRPLAVLWSAV